MDVETSASPDRAWLDDDPDQYNDVALVNTGETEHNTIVLGGVNVVIPLEMDMDGDPFQDDAVCLRSLNGHWEDVRLSSDPEVTVSRDKRHLYYEFRDVPPGVYCVDVRIADRWTTVMSGLMVSRGSISWRDRVFGEEPPENGAAPDDPHFLVDAISDTGPADAAEAEHACCC